MSSKRALPRIIALRYVRIGKRSHLVSFMSAVSIFGLALGISLLIAVLSVMNGFDREMRENILGIVPHLTISSAENVSQAQWDEIDSILADYGEIQQTGPSIQVAGVIASDSGNRGVLVNGIEAATENAISVMHRFVISGSLAALEDQRWGIALGDDLARQLGKGVGDRVDLFSLDVSTNPLTPLPSYRQFTVVAIYNVGTQQLDADTVTVNLSAARALYKVRSPYTGLRIKLDDVLDADDFRLTLLNELPGQFTISSWSSLLGNVYQNILFSRTIVGFMLWILIAVAAFNLVVSLIMVVRDKTGDIAILRTLGASPAMINRIFLWQGCMVGLIGTGIGVLFGVILAWNVSDIAGMLENRFGIRFLSAEVYPIDFLPSQLLVNDILLVTGGVLLLSLMATIYPARRAAAIQPAEALRTD